MADNCASIAIALILAIGDSDRRPPHVTEELSYLTFALHLCFVPDGTSRAHASVSHSEGMNKAELRACAQHERICDDTP